MEQARRAELVRLSGELAAIVLRLQEIDGALTQFHAQTNALGDTITGPLSEGLAQLTIVDSGLQELATLYTDTESVTPPEGMVEVRIGDCPECGNIRHLFGVAEQPADEAICGECVADAREALTCPSCGAGKGENVTEDCEDPRGCGFWKQLGFEQIGKP
jgi:hypothetical protein